MAISAASMNASLASGSYRRAAAVPRPISSAGAPRFVVLEPLERGGVVRLGLEVGEPFGRGDRGLLGVVDGLALAVQVAALDVVVGELGGRREPELVERLRDPVVHPHPPGRALALVQRLAHQRVGEREAVGVVGDLAHEPGLVRLPRAR